MDNDNIDGQTDDDDIDFFSLCVEIYYIDGLSNTIRYTAATSVFLFVHWYTNHVLLTSTKTFVKAMHVHRLQWA